MSDYNLTEEDIKKYTVELDVTQDWVSARDPSYPVNSVSLKANRYNRDGEFAYYIASGSNTLQAEVQELANREIYHCSSSVIHVFDLAGWSEDFDCRDDFLKSKADGGHGICQQISDQLINKPGLSGILYNSERMHAAGQTGSCAVILPHSGSLIDQTFFVKDLGSP